MTRYLPGECSTGAAGPLVLVPEEGASINAGSDLACITVGTPTNKDGSVGLTCVKNTAITIGPPTKHY